MTRLTHTAEGRLRAMQISEIGLFAFVEGGLDRPFVERILRSQTKDKVKYRIYSAKEVCNGTGGKIALLDLFSRYKEAGKLLTETWGKKTISIFFLDKDVDDFLGSAINSSHIAYTPTYDVEGALFQFGDLVSALSDTCHITSTQAASIIGNKDEWLARITSKWADWITLCLISQLKKINTGCTFDRVSAINPGLLGDVDNSQLSTCKRQLFESSQMEQVEFENLYSKTKDIVSDATTKGESLKFFKGKWLKSIAQKQIDTAPRIPDSNIQGVGERIASVLVSQVAATTGCGCSAHYGKFITTAISRLT